MSVFLVRQRQERPAAVVAVVRPAHDRLIVRLDGVTTREDATKLTHVELWLPRAAVAPLADNEFFVEDLVGCEVFDLGGESRGVVRSSFWNGSQDILTVVDDAGVELLVPVVPDFLRKVDFQRRRVVVDTHE